MTTTLQLETDRLILRPMDATHLAAFAAMNADPDVMTYFAAPMTHEETAAAIARYQAAHERDGFGFMAAELRSTNEFAGVIGLQIMRDEVPGLPQPAVEIGWRLRREHQGNGLATEGAQAIIDFAFNDLHLSSVVAITAAGNAPSRHVMDKLGMQLQPQLDFDHPRVPAGHPHQRHVLYRLINPRNTTRQEA
jgi:RimJ/RimL family protein N-acetyltransferase